MMAESSNGSYVEIKSSLQNQTKYWRSTELFQKQELARGRPVIALLDRTCWNRSRNGTDLRSIYFKYGADDIWYCGNVSYRVYQDHDAVFFDGPPTSTCPFHPWSRPL